MWIYSFNKHSVGTEYMLDILLHGVNKNELRYGLCSQKGLKSCNQTEWNYVRTMSYYVKWVNREAIGHFN